MSEIRKISVGTNFPDGCIHYQVGKTLNILGQPYEISEIIKTVDKGVLTYNIYISNHFETVIWKSVQSMPVLIEFNQTFS